MKTCPECGSLYQPKEKRQVLCSKRCASLVANRKQAQLRADATWLAHWQERQRQAMAARYGTHTIHVSRRCQVCEQVFSPKEQRQNVCSRHCAARKARASQLAQRRDQEETVQQKPVITHHQKITPPEQHTLTLARPNEKTEPIPLTMTRETLQALQADYAAAGKRYEPLATKQEQRKDTDAFLVLAGYGASLRVKDNALVVFPGKTHAHQQAQSRTYYRGMQRPTHIIILKEMPATITTDAISWCKEQGISLHILDLHGNEIQTLAAASTTDIALRRTQYLLSSDQRAIIARLLLEKKLRSQLETLQQHQDVPRCQEAVSILRDALSWFAMERPMIWMSRLDILRAYEGRAAKAYFAAWVGLPLKWEKQAAKKIPPHWKTVRERHSPLSSNARHAIDPCNAMLNYAYACLESQCRQSLIAQGFDTACGVLHADQQGRDSLVYDLMELFRANVDALVLHFIKRTLFHAGDMTLAHNGSIRFHPELARYLVATCRLPQSEIDQGACWLKQQFLTLHMGAAYVG